MPLTKVQTRYGTMCIISTDPYCSESLRRYGEWAGAELEILARIIQPGMTVVDGGAYIGSHTLAFSQFVGSSGRVHAFEVNPEYFTILRRNVTLNGAKNVLCHNLGLSNASSQAFIAKVDYSLNANYGGMSVLPAKKRKSHGDIRIRFVSLDCLIDGKLDVIKLDIEGMEESALLGASQVLTSNHPIVYAECNNLENGVRLLLVMQAYGYTVFGSLTSAFNPQNFSGVRENIFGDAREVGLLMVHASQLSLVSQQLAQFHLPQIKSFDDLALVLLHKPQYPTEILQKTEVGRELSVNYSSPRAQEELDEKDRMLAEVQALALGRQEELDEKDRMLGELRRQLVVELTKTRRYQMEIDALHSQANDSMRQLADTMAHATQLRSTLMYISTGWRKLVPISFFRKTINRLLKNPPS